MIRSRGSCSSVEIICWRTTPFALSTTVMMATVPTFDQPTITSPSSCTIRALRNSVSNWVVDAALASLAKNWNWPTSSPEHAEESATPFGMQESNFSNSERGARVPKRS